MASYKDTGTQTSLSGDCHCLHHPGSVPPTISSDDIAARFDEATQRMTTLMENMLTSHRDQSEELLKSYFGNLLRDLPTHVVGRSAVTIVPPPGSVAHQQPAHNQPDNFSRVPREARIDYTKYDFKASLKDAIKAAEMSTLKTVPAPRNVHTGLDDFRDRDDRAPKPVNTPAKIYDDEDYSGIQSLRDRIRNDSSGGVSSFVKQSGQVVSTSFERRQRSDHTLLSRPS